MEAEARYTWVGAAVLALLAALVVAVLWLRNVGGDDMFNRFAIHFENQALDGLEVGADVTLRGIRVGRVEQYGLSADTPNRVRVQVRVDRHAPVRTDTVAVVTRNFVTGIAAITLVNDNTPAVLLVKVPEGETLPVISEGRSNLQEITGRVNKVGDLATVAIGNLNQLLAPENRETFVATVASIKDLAVGINQRLDSMDAAVTRISHAATEMGHAATQATGAINQIGGAAASIGQAAANVGQVAAGLGQVGERVAVVAEQSGQRLGDTLAGTERAIGDARQALAQVSKTVDALQLQAGTTASRLEKTAAGVDDQLSAATAELRLTLETATRVLDRLREPRAALLGPGPAQLGPGEKTP